MNRQKLYSALAGWLTVPALAAAQTDGPRFTSEPSPRLSAPNPTHLPDPTTTPKNVTTDPLPPPAKVVTSEPAKPPAKIALPEEKGGKSPAAEIIIPKRAEPRTAVTIEELPYDPRPYNQRWLRRGGGGVAVEEGTGCAANRYAIDPATGSLVWVVPEWLLWTTSGLHVPALVTSSPLGTDRTRAGVIGESGTQIVFGNDSQLTTFRSGLRVRAGFWLDPTQTLGFEGGIFYLGQRANNRGFGSQGDPIGLHRPYFDIFENRPSAEPIAFGERNIDGSLNTSLSGTVIAQTTTDLWGGEATLRRHLYSNESLRIDGLLGYRYQRLRDTIETSSLSTIGNDATLFDLPIGSTLQIRDLFQTTNNFHGGQIGLAADWRRDRWFLGLTGKLAMGVVQQEVRINGLTTITQPGGEAQVFSGGLLAQPTNIGRYRSDRFSVIPELGLNLGYQLSSNVRLFAGYNVMYWSSVVRAGEQIDPNVNPTQAPRTVPPAALLGAPRPGFSHKESGFWAHGTNVGLEIRW